MPIESRDERLVHGLVLATTKGALSAIPLVGGVLAEYAGVLGETIKARADRWEEQVTAAVNEIEERFDRLPTELFRDEGFVTALQLASTIALRESRREKVDLLKNALISSASGKYEPFAQEQLMRQVEALTPEHIQVLGWAHESAEALAVVATLEDAYGAFVRSAPAAHREVFRSVVHDLTSRFLIVLVDINDYGEYESKKQVLITENGEGRPQFMVTAQGRQLIDFLYAT
jgi:hypothetical protein